MKLLIIAALAAGIAVPALAAPAAPFNGPFVGVQGGWQQDQLRLSTIDAGTGIRSREKNDGFAYGGQIGYDYRLSPRFVLGAEASISGRTGRGYLNDGFGDVYRLTEGRTLNATGRLGYLIGDRGLLYARGGYSNARFALRDPVQTVGQDRDGYTVGVGYEQALTRTVSARLEYNYSDYGSKNARNAAFDTGTDSVRADYRRNAVTAGLNLHF